MATHDYVIANASGAAVRSDLNGALAAIVSNNSATTPGPTTTYGYQWWADETAGLMKIRNSTNDGWVSLFNLDGSSLGPGKVTFGATEVVFNDAGNNVDFRIEGDTNANLFFVDASADKIGIGTTSPSSLLHLSAASGSVQMQINSGGNSTYIGHDSGFTGLDFAAGGGIRFRYFTGAAYANAALIDTSGRLLVGTATTSATNTVLVQGHSGGSTGQGIIHMAVGAATPSDGAQLGKLQFSDNTHSVSCDIAAMRDGGTWSGTSKPTRLVFSTTPDGPGGSPTERMRIGQNGYFKASTNGTYNGTDAHNFYQSNTNVFGLIVGGYGSYTSTVFVLQGTNATSTAFNLIEGYYGGNQTTGSGASIAIRVRGDGNITNLNNSYGAISDIKLKENIVDANSQWSDIKALQVRRYNFKEGQTHTQIGLVAQEVELVSPGLVTESPDRDEDGNDLGTVTKSVNYSVLYMKAVKALQEAMERIEQLEAKVSVLESKP